MSQYQDVVKFLAEQSGTVEIKYPYWIRGEAGENWCRYCGKAMARHLRRRSKRGEKQNYILDGGYLGGDEDGCARCAGCGCLLHYTLTDYGTENELSHFLEHWNAGESIHPETSYELQAVFEGGINRVDLSAQIDLLADRVRAIMEMEVE